MDYYDRRRIYLVVQLTGILYYMYISSQIQKLADRTRDYEAESLISKCHQIQIHTKQTVVVSTDDDSTEHCKSVKKYSACAKSSCNGLVTNSSLTSRIDSCHIALGVETKMRPQVRTQPGGKGKEEDKEELGNIKSRKCNGFDVRITTRQDCIWLSLPEEQ